MTVAIQAHDPERWLNQIFAARVVLNGGVVRRAVRDVEARIGRTRLEVEVRRRGYHMAECGGQFIIVCDPSPMKVIC